MWLLAGNCYESPFLDDSKSSQWFANGVITQRAHPEIFHFQESRVPIYSRNFEKHPRNFGLVSDLLISILYISVFICHIFIFGSCHRGFIDIMGNGLCIHNPLRRWIHSDSWDDPGRPGPFFRAPMKVDGGARCGPLNLPSSSNVTVPSNLTWAG